ADDVDLALDERHQLDGRGETLDGHHRRAVRVADGDVSEGERRRRKDRGRRGAVHPNRMAENPFRLDLKGRAIVVPVDEPRGDEGREQRDHDQTPDKKKKPAQLNAPPGRIDQLLDESPSQPGPTHTGIAKWQRWAKEKRRRWFRVAGYDHRRQRR